MTETQTPTNHRAPLAPGEVRHFEIAGRTYRVMHTGGGAYTQATVHELGVPTVVLGTHMFEHDAVAAYADAIEAAEAEAKTVDLVELTDRMGLPASQQQGVAAFVDGPGPWTEAEAAELVSVWQHTDEDGVYHEPEPTAPTPGPFDQAIAEAKRFEEIDRAAVARGESANWWERTGEPTVTPLAELLDAYGEQLAKASMHVATGDRWAATAHAGLADALKAEILARFGGGR